MVPSVLIKHEEYIAAEVRPRGSAYGSREETVEMALTIGADAPYEPFTPLAVPTPTPHACADPAHRRRIEGACSDSSGGEWPW